MRIEPRETLAGVSMLRIRDLMRWMRGALTFYSSAGIAAFLELSQPQTETVIAELLQRQMIVQDDMVGRDGQPQYRIAPLGVRMAAARATKPIKRATAERLLSEFEARIESVNEEEHFLYRVSRVVLFGSYLSNVPTLGDIDLIVHLEEKETNSERHKELCIERNLEFLRRGWNLDFVTLYAAYDILPRREVFVALRNRSSYLSLHAYMDEVVIEHQPHEVLYGAAEYVIPDAVRRLYGVESEMRTEREFA
ncbi:MAG: nucleotidyltransferase domain-containing protein [Caldilineaceae bacterium]|nr:nucleotidyltransferase domain-containing protein [Caldilineaceae bacterium]